MVQLPAHPAARDDAWRGGRRDRCGAARHVRRVGHAREDDGRGLTVTIFDLVRTFQSVLDSLKNRPLYEIGKEDVSVPEMMRFVGDQLTKSRRSDAISAIQLFEMQRSRRAMICLFLAILELVKRRTVELTQAEAFGDIGLRRGADFNGASPNNPEDVAVVEQEYR